MTNATIIRSALLAAASPKSPPSLSSIPLAIGARRCALAGRRTKARVAPPHISPTQSHTDGRVPPMVPFKESLGIIKSPPTSPCHYSTDGRNWGHDMQQNTTGSKLTWRSIRHERGTHKIHQDPTCHIITQQTSPLRGQFSYINLIVTSTSASTPSGPGELGFLQLERVGKRLD